MAKGRNPKWRKTALKETIPYSADYMSVSDVSDMKTPVLVPMSGSNQHRSAEFRQASSP
jgi:hypothetical protein